jgi:thioredoxin-dependent peroxiredoxin
MLKPGAKAPDFTLKSDEEKEIALRDFQGKRVFIFFFPKSNTPG